VSNQEIELSIESMAHGGSGVGRWRDRAVFVPYTIPGERVTARIVEEAERRTIAEGVTLLDASADRVYPVCPHFGQGKCGRCHWQHMNYQAQLLIKQDVLADQLSRLGRLSDRQIAAALHPTLPSPDEWYYNYHMTLTVTEDQKLGFPSADGKGIYPIRECHILHPDLLALYQEQMDIDLTGIRRVRLQMGSDGERMIILTATEDDAPELEVDFPASVNLILPSNEPMNLIGDSHSRYAINGRTFRVTAGSFIRPNYSQMTNLVATVEALLDLRAGQAALDLYAGVGVFSAFMAARAGLVTLVESYPPAVTDADDNLADLDNVDVIEGGVEAVLPSLEDRYSAAVIDPPQGLGREAFEALMALEIPRLVYVSDDPAVLAKDAKHLARSGYRLSVAQPIDLSPQTYYVDTVALFLKG
jgi:23S rRNA (uracil1939-C5)-methyltransferase